MKRQFLHTIQMNRFFLLGLSLSLFLLLQFSTPISSPDVSMPSTPSTLPTSASNGQLQTESTEIIWFLHITDTQNMWYNPQRIAWFREFLNSTQKILNPYCIINTGDLVDSDYSGFFKVHNGQRIEEWVTYSSILNETGMNASFYYDVMGNHDRYYDKEASYYRNYSMQKQPYYDFTLNTTRSQYHFIGLNVPEDHGARYPFGLFGMLNNTELDWYEQKLEAHKGANVQISFGHMPAYEIYEGHDRFFAINRKYGVDLYLTGHGHINDVELVDRKMVSYETGHLSEYENSFRIIAFDNYGLSTSLQSKNGWPMGMITNPVCTDAVYGDYNQTKLVDVNEVHVLAWDPKGIQSVEWRATLEKDDEDTFSAWTPMQWKEGPLYVAPWNSALADGKDHLIQTRIINVDGTEKIEQIEYRSEAKFHFGWWLWRPLMIFLGIFMMLGIPSIKYGLRQMGKIKTKSSYETVDPLQRKYLMVKCASLLIVPLAFMPLIPGEIVGFFGLFIWSAEGIFLNDIAGMAIACAGIFGILIPAANISPKKRYWLLFVSMPLSLLLEALIVVYLIITMGTICLIAPGMYVLMLMDVLIMRRAAQIIKNQRK